MCFRSLTLQWSIASATFRRPQSRGKGILFCISYTAPDIRVVAVGFRECHSAGALCRVPVSHALRQDHLRSERGTPKTARDDSRWYKSWGGAQHMKVGRLSRLPSRHDLMSDF